MSLPPDVRQCVVVRERNLLVAGSFLTGSWYALALVGADVPADWAERTAALVWRACGGSVGPTVE